MVGVASRPRSASTTLTRLAVATRRATPGETPSRRGHRTRNQNDPGEHRPRREPLNRRHCRHRPSQQPETHHKRRRGASARGRPRRSKRARRRLLGKYGGQPRSVTTSRAGPSTHRPTSARTKQTRRPDQRTEFSRPGHAPVILERTGPFQCADILASSGPDSRHRLS